MLYCQLPGRPKAIYQASLQGACHANLRRDQQGHRSTSTHLVSQTPLFPLPNTSHVHIVAVYITRTSTHLASCFSTRCFLACWKAASTSAWQQQQQAASAASSSHAKRGTTSSCLGCMLMAGKHNLTCKRQACEMLFPRLGSLPTGKARSQLYMRALSRPWPPSSQRTLCCGTGFPSAATHANTDTTPRGDHPLAPLGVRAGTHQHVQPVHLYLHRHPPQGAPGHLSRQVSQ